MSAAYLDRARAAEAMADAATHDGDKAAWRSAAAMWQRYATTPAKAPTARGIALDEQMRAARAERVTRVERAAIAEHITLEGETVEREHALASSIVF